MIENMSIHRLSDEQLHRNLLSLKSKEDHILASIISHLEEVYRRRLFSHYKCSSLNDYCVRILGYSNGEAHRKVSACRLAAHCEGVKESIAKGELSLSNAAAVQVFLNQTSKLHKTLTREPNEMTNEAASVVGADDRENQTENQTGNQNQKHNSQPGPGLEAKSIVERVKNMSARDCEKELEKIAVENHLQLPQTKLSKRNVGDKTILKLSLDREQLELLKSRLRVSCEQELIESLIKEKLSATEPRTDVKQRARKQPGRKPRSLSPAKKAIVFKNAGSKCENCGSRQSLQIDHRLPVAKGGSNSVDNLRVLCRPCNQRAAIEQLGLEVMDPHLNLCGHDHSFPGVGAKVHCSLPANLVRTPSRCLGSPD